MDRDARFALHLLPPGFLEIWTVAADQHELVVARRPGCAPLPTGVVHVPEHVRRTELQRPVSQIDASNHSPPPFSASA
jgi:hypothetical protein